MTFFFIVASIYIGIEVLTLFFQRLAASRPPGTEKPATVTLTPLDNTILLAGVLFFTIIICRGLPIWWAAPFSVYLLFSACMDAKTMRVYDTVQLAAIVWQFAAFGWLVCTRHPSPLPLILGLALYAAFLAVQLWQRCYGLADTLAFIACGLFITNVVLFAGTISVFEALAYLLALANGFFLITNLGNLSRGLRLKQRIAFIPSIALATMLLLNTLVY